MARASTKSRTQKRRSGLRKKGGDGEKKAVSLLFGKTINEESQYDSIPEAVTAESMAFGYTWDDNIPNKRVRFEDYDKFRKLSNQQFVTHLQNNPEYNTFDVTVPMPDADGNTDYKYEKEKPDDDDLQKVTLKISKQGFKNLPLSSQAGKKVQFLYDKKIDDDLVPSEGGRRRRTASKRRSSKRRSGKKSVSKTAKRKL